MTTTDFWRLIAALSLWASLTQGGQNLMKLEGFLYVREPTGPTPYRPDISPMAISEFLAQNSTGRLPLLWGFMDGNQGVIGALPAEAQVQQVQLSSKQEGVSLKEADASVVASALIDGAPVLSNDDDMLEYLDRIHWKNYDWARGPSYYGFTP